jgi:DNA-binding transcriptional LysR family regulator
VTTPLPIGVHLLAPALPRFRERHPKLSIDLRLGDRIVDLIEEGIDVAVRVGELADSRLIARRLAPYRLLRVCLTAYLAKRGTPRHPEDLVQHDCVNFRYQSSGRPLPWPFRVGERTLEIVPSATITADVGDAVTAVLSAGGGIGISATFVAAPYVERGELVPVLSEFAVDRSAITALWPESRRGSPNVKAFVAFLGELFPSPAPWDVRVAQASKLPNLR